MSGFISPWRRAAAVLCFSAVLALGIAACGDDDETNNPPPEGVVPDFALKDVNPASTTHNDDVSPRDYLGGVSAYYFGDAG
ncbi:MAG TPA: hypothetical protein VF720_16940 [Candidatus Eisenbacteria bacterium]